MSLFALLSTAVAIPLGIASIAIVFFYLRARSVAQKKAAIEQRRQERQSVRDSARSAITGNSTAPFSRPIPVSGDSMPEFRPLSFYMAESRPFHPPATVHPLSEIPGLDARIQHALIDLGYTSVEQVARWGRSDVRTVSAILGVDQGVIESTWIANARSLLSVA
jgi:predicted flap endonuclease-1-like 5' DNA nuclease